MELLAAELKRCKTCRRLSGHVDERCNGAVPVYCRCQIKERFGGRWESPSMISLADDRLMWKPISDHREADGRRWHMPWFAGMATNQKQLGEEIPGWLLDKNGDDSIESLPPPPLPPVPLEELPGLKEMEAPATAEEELLASMILTPEEVGGVVPGEAWGEDGVSVLLEPEGELAAGLVTFWGAVVSREGEDFFMELSLYETADAASGALRHILGQSDPEGVEVDRFDAEDIGDEAQGFVQAAKLVFTTVVMRADRVLANIALITADEERPEKVCRLAEKLAEKIDAVIQGYCHSQGASDENTVEGEGNEVGGP